MDDVIVDLSHAEAHLIHDVLELLVPLLHVLHVRTQVSVHEAERRVVQVEVDAHTSLVALNTQREDKEVIGIGTKAMTLELERKQKRGGNSHLMNIVDFILVICSCSTKGRVSSVIEKRKQRIEAEAAWTEMAEVIGRSNGITT